MRRTVVTVTLTLVCIIATGAVAGFAYTAFQTPKIYAFSIPADTGIGTTSLEYGYWPALADPHFYETVKQRFIEQKLSFISANLSSMQLEVYQNGEEKLALPILAKGRVGSWWQTPVGLYDIKTKESKHFSTIGKVYQPWSLAFDGNFFIHGWPYYPDGTEVSTSYSGGCIRLSTEDAEKIYELASVGMPVLVYESKDPTPPVRYTLRIPEITAQAYVVADIANGTALFGSRADETYSIASITKLMTALVVTEHLNLAATVLVPESALVKTSIPRLSAGQKITVHDLLLLLLRESSNEAAEVLANAVGRNTFIRYMNQSAKAINLTHTTFTDPSGSDAGNESTAEDLFTLVSYISENRRFIFDITSGKKMNDAYGDGAYDLQNFNIVPGVSLPFIGGKIGKSTSALETYAGAFTVPTPEGNRAVAVIVLGSEDAYVDTNKILSTLMNFLTASSTP